MNMQRNDKNLVRLISDDLIKGLPKKLPEIICISGCDDNIQNKVIQEVQSRVQSLVTSNFFDDDVYYHYVVDKKTKEWNIKKVWLPRQDQLQEMLDWDIYGSYHTSLKVSMLEKFCCSKTKIGIETEDITMEQLWLAFVMSEKFSKQWTGEKWEKIRR